APRAPAVDAELPRAFSILVSVLRRSEVESEMRDRAQGRALCVNVGAIVEPQGLLQLSQRIVALSQSAMHVSESRGRQRLTLAITGVSPAIQCGAVPFHHEGSHVDAPVRAKRFGFGEETIRLDAVAVVDRGAVSIPYPDQVAAANARTVKRSDF